VRQQRQAVKEVEASAASSSFPRENLAFPLFELLWPVAWELVRWRLLTFYEVDGAKTAAADACVKILAAGLDWTRTWNLLRRERRRFEKRERRELGFLLGKLALRGLETSRAVRKAAKRVGVRAEELGCAMEAFAERREGSVTAMVMVERKEWEVLAGFLLMDREGVALVRKDESENERQQVWAAITAEQDSILQRYFSLLEYENQCAGICCFSGCRKRKVVYGLSRSEMEQLDGSLELQRQLVRVSRPATVRVVSERDDKREHTQKNAGQARRQRKRVRSSVDADEQEQKGESPRKASLDSEKERQKRRTERREFVFGKEEDENESEDEKAEAQQKEWKRKLSVDKVTASNAKWEQEYSGC
jgi:hypothetical protein